MHDGRQTDREKITLAILTMRKQLPKLQMKVKLDLYGPFHVDYDHAWRTVL